MTEEQKRRHGHRPQKQRKKQELPEIFFCGDPHGEFSQILSAARDYKPAAMVILGDLQPSKPLEEVLAEAMAFTEIWWIPGNHDTDSDAIYDNLWKSPLAAHTLHGSDCRARGRVPGADLDAGRKAELCLGWSFSASGWEKQHVERWTAEASSLLYFPFRL